MLNTTMVNLSTDAQHCRCRFCSECTGGCKEFQKLLQLKPGVAIYRHVPQASKKITHRSYGGLVKDTPNNVIIDARGNISPRDVKEQESKWLEDQTDRVIVHNMDNADIVLADFLPEFDKLKISCLRCRRIVANARNLLQKINVVNKNEIRGVCEICKVKQYQNLGPVPCVICERMGKNLAISLMKDSIKKRVIQTTELGHVRRRRSYSDVDIEKLMKIRDAYYINIGISTKPKIGPVLMSMKTSSGLKEAKSTDQEDYESEKLYKQEARLFGSTLTNYQYDEASKRPAHGLTDQMKHVSRYSKDMSKVSQQKVLSEAGKFAKDHEHTIREITDKNNTFTVFHIDGKIKDVDKKMIGDMYPPDFYTKQDKLLNDKDEIAKKDDKKHIVFRKRISEGKLKNQYSDESSDLKYKEIMRHLPYTQSTTNIKSKISHHKVSREKDLQDSSPREEASPILRTRSPTTYREASQIKETSFISVQKKYMTPKGSSHIKHQTYLTQKESAHHATPKKSLLHASQSSRKTNIFVHSEDVKERHKAAKPEQTQFQTHPHSPLSSSREMSPHKNLPSKKESSPASQTLKKETTSAQRKEVQDRHEAAKRERTKVQTDSHPPLSSSRIKGILRRKPSQHGGGEGKSHGPSQKKVDTSKLRTRVHSDDSIVTSFTDIKPGMSRKNLKYFFPRQTKKKGQLSKSSTYLIKETKDKFKVIATEKKQKGEGDFQKQKEREEKKERAKEEKSSREQKGNKKQVERTEHDEIKDETVKKKGKDDSEPTEPHIKKERKISREERDDEVKEKKKKVFTVQDGEDTEEIVKKNDKGGSESKVKPGERKTFREKRDDKIIVKKREDLTGQDVFKAEKVKKMDKGRSKPKEKTRETRTSLENRGDEIRNKKQRDLTDQAASKDTGKEETAKKKEKDKTDAKEIRPPEPEISQKKEEKYETDAKEIRPPEPEISQKKEEKNKTDAKEIRPPEPEISQKKEEKNKTDVKEIRPPEPEISHKKEENDKTDAKEIRPPEPEVSQKMEERSKIDAREIRPPVSEISQNILNEIEAETDEGKEIRPKDVLMKTSTLDSVRKKSMQKKPEVKQTLSKKPKETEANEEIQLLNIIVKKQHIEKHNKPLKRIEKHVEHKEIEIPLTRSEDFAERLKYMTFKIHDAKVKYPEDDIMRKLINKRLQEKSLRTKQKTLERNLPSVPRSVVIGRKHKKKFSYKSADESSNLELDMDLLLAKFKKRKIESEGKIIIGKKIISKMKVSSEPIVERQPVALFQSVFDASMPVGVSSEVGVKETSSKDIEIDKPQLPPAAFKYQLSDRYYIENGWTELPSVKFMRKLACCMKNQNVDFEENTFKHYYFPISDADDDDNSLSIISNKRTAEESLDELFEMTKKKTIKKVCASTVGRSTADGMSYISTNVEDAETATHLIKIQIYDMKKLANIDPEDHWKNPDVRVKYYVNKHNNNNHHQRARGLIYSITKEISKGHHT